MSCFKNSCMQLHSVAVREQICSLARFFFLRSDFCELAASQVVLYCPERDSEITTGARQIFEFLLTQSLRQTLVGGTHTWHGLAEGPSSSNLRVPTSCELGASGQARWQHPHPQKLAACTPTTEGLRGQGEVLQCKQIEPPICWYVGMGCWWDTIGPHCVPPGVGPCGMGFNRGSWQLHTVAVG